MIITTDREGIARIGEYVKRGEGVFEVIGYALDDKEQDCLVCAAGLNGNSRRTLLVPVCDVERKFVEVAVGTDASVLTLRGKCGGCVRDGCSREWRCNYCVRRDDEDVRDYYETKEEYDED